MGQVKEIKIKNGTYCFFNDIFDVFYVFDPNLLQINKKPYKDIDIYYIGYITIKKINDYENVNVIYCVNPFYLITGEVDGHIEEKMGVNI